MFQYTLQQEHGCKTPLVFVSKKEYLTCVDHLHQALQDVQDGNGKDDAWQSMTIPTKRKKWQASTEICVLYCHLTPEAFSTTNVKDTILASTICELSNDPRTILQ